MPFSCLDDRIQQKLTEYERLYKQAESAIKYCEVQQLEGLMFPPINELRYSGQHITRAFMATDINAALKCFDEGLRHIRRAIYDAYDASVNYYLEQCRLFESDYKNITITSINNNFIAEKKGLERLKESIAQEDRSRTEDYYESKKEQIRIVKEIYENWDVSRGESNKLMKRQMLRTWIAILTLLLAALGLLVA